MKSEKATFAGAGGDALVARLESPAGEIRAYALFAHCFTCSKDIFAASRIAAALASNGIATLRFDFTGLGASGGDFANTNFSSNVGDLIAAADWLRAEREAPSILIGHSLGGAAVLAAAGAVEEAVGVATIGAPSDPGHVAHLFEDDIAAIERDGEADVRIAGRPFRIRKQFLDDIQGQRLRDKVAGLRKALLVMHAPLDRTVGIDNAAEIFQAARHPKSFVSLDSADHLLTRREDAVYAAEMVAAWASRFLPPKRASGAEAEAGAVVVAENGIGRFGQDIAAGEHRLRADEPASVGGLDRGPTPYQLLSSALGTCTTMTLRMYAQRKQWPLERAAVTVRQQKIHAADCAECETADGKIDSFEREIELVGPLDEEQRARLLEIADKCPVHRTPHGEVRVTTTLRPVAE
ncbi:MAG: alpha/beta fold hydrolase [Defluviicoccus sp.]|nr:alpha/beta fold hydrolase [Defluviicoccus sp.]MDE0382266.1 alpha/beta fold hydrolase [Defluviicoccus sp.]